MTADAPDYGALRLAAFLEALASRRAAPGGGAAAAVAVALGAALCAMAARASPRHVPDAGAVAQEADALSSRAVLLGGEDAAAYGRVLAARAAAPGAGAGPDGEGHGGALADTLSGAADVALAVAEIGERVARLAGDLARDGNPALRGDALTGAVLARAGVEAAGALVAIDLAGADDPRPALARTLLAAATASVARARAAAEPGGAWA